MVSAEHRVPSGNQAKVTLRDPVHDVVGHESRLQCVQLFFQDL
jgi:hypothetical protein